MTKAQLIAKVAQKSGLSQKDTNIVIESLIETISEALKDDDNVGFLGFGTFTTVQRAPRESKIPTTGKIVKVPAKRAVRFRVGKMLKESLNP